MQEELSALKSVLHTKDELITDLKERLDSVSAPKESSAKPLTRPEMLMENPQPEQLPVEEEPHCSTDPHPRSTAPLHRTREKHMLLS